VKDEMTIAWETAVQVTRTKLDQLRAERDEALSRLKAVGDLLSEIGCQCDCECLTAYEDHEADCEECEFCRIEKAAFPRVRPANRVIKTEEKTVERDYPCRACGRVDCAGCYTG
jgi:hypothetical protein